MFFQIIFLLYKYRSQETQLIIYDEDSNNFFAYSADFLFLPVGDVDADEQATYNANIAEQNNLHIKPINCISHNIIVISRITEWQLERKIQFDMLDNDKYIPKLYNTIFYCFLDQLNANSHSIDNIADKALINSIVDMKKIDENIHLLNNTNFFAFQLSYLIKSYTYSKKKWYQKTAYNFYSPFFIAFMMNFGTHAVEKLNRFLETKECKVFEILYMHTLINYYRNTNLRALYSFDTYNKSQGLIDMSGGFFCFATIFYNPRFYNTMIRLHNIEVLQHFVSPVLYNLLVRYTNLTTLKFANDKFSAINNCAMYYYVVVFSLFFVDNGSQKFWTNDATATIDQAYKIIDTKLMAHADSSYFVLSSIFSTSLSISYKKTVFFA